MNLAWPDQSWSGPTWPDLAYLRSGQGPTWPNWRDATDKKLTRLRLETFSQCRTRRTLHLVRAVVCLHFALYTPTIVARSNVTDIFIIIIIISVLRDKPRWCPMHDWWFRSRTCESCVNIWILFSRHSLSNTVRYFNVRCYDRRHRQHSIITTKNQVRILITGITGKYLFIYLLLPEIISVTITM